MPHKFKASSGISFLLLSGFVPCTGVPDSGARHPISGVKN